MIKGIRKELELTTGGNIYFVKTKQWPDGWMRNQRNGTNGDRYIIGHPNMFRHWHNNKMIQVSILHEFGHCRNKFKSFFLNEVWASGYGFFKYRKAFAPHLTILDLLKDLWFNRAYFFGKVQQPDI